MQQRIKLKFKLFAVSMLLLFASSGFVFAQFVDAPNVSESVSTPAIESGVQVETIFDVLIIISALMFIISMFGFGIGFLKMITSGGDEITAETGSNMLVLSGWIFGASALSYLLVNIVKYFIY